MLRELYDALAGRLDPEVEARIDRIATDLNEYGYDKWGFSPDAVRKAMSVYAWLYRHYWRVSTHGIEHVPPGRGLLIGNHSSQLAYDGIMVATAMVLDAEPPLVARPRGSGPSGLDGHDADPVRPHLVPQRLGDGL